MKLFQITMIVTLLAISFPNIQSTRILAKNRIQNKGHKENLIQILNGCISTLGGGDKRLQACLPRSIREVPGQDDKTTSLTASGGPLKTIVRVIGAVIKLACKFKGPITSFIKKVCGARRLRRRFMLVEVGSKKWGWIKRAYNKVKRGIKKVVRKVVNAIKDVAMWAIRGILWVFKKCASAIISVKNKVVGFFKSDLFKKILHFFKCLLTFRNAARTLIKNIKNFKKALIKMSNLAGFIEVFVNAVCNWREFQTVVEYFVSAAKNSGSSKYNFIGKGVGGLVQAIGNSN